MALQIANGSVGFTLPGLKNNTNDFIQFFVFKSFRNFNLKKMWPRLKFMNCGGDSQMDGMLVNNNVALVIIHYHSCRR